MERYVLRQEENFDLREAFLDVLARQKPEVVFLCNPNNPTGKLIPPNLLPNITPHVCRHTYCSNMAKSGMNPKTLQYLMGHSDISVTMNVYTHISFDDAEEELKRVEEFRKAQAEIEKNEKPMSQKMFKVI